LLIASVVIIACVVIIAYCECGDIAYCKCGDIAHCECGDYCLLRVIASVVIIASVVLGAGDSRPDWSHHCVPDSRGRSAHLIRH
jgi:hypothetical protein